MGALGEGRSLLQKVQRACEGPDLEGPVRVYQIKVFLAPDFEFDGMVSYDKGQFVAKVEVGGVRVWRRHAIPSFARAKAQIDGEYRKIYLKFLEWLNLRLFADR